MTPERSYTVLNADTRMPGFLGHRPTSSSRMAAQKPAAIDRKRQIKESGIEQTVVAIRCETSNADIVAGSAGLSCPQTLRPVAPRGEELVCSKRPAGEWPRCGVFLFWQAERVRRDPNCFGAEGGNPSAECLKPQ